MSGPLLTAPGGRGARHSEPRVARRVDTRSGTAAAVLVRGTTLLQLLAATLLLPTADHRLVAVALGVGAAAQLFTDSGAAAYLSVVDARRELLAGLVRRLLAVQLVACAVATLGSALLLLRLTDDVGPWVTVGVLVIPATSAVESVGRLGRVVWLRDGQVQRYAALDATYAGARTLPVAGLLLGLGAPAFVVGLAGALVVTVAAWATVVRELGPGAAHDQGLVMTARDCLGYGLPVMAAALYSQAPVVVTSAVSSLETAAVMAVATRLVQPLEVVAATQAQMSLPGLARDPNRPGPFLRTIGAQGVVVAVLGAVGAMVFLVVTSSGTAVWWVTFLLLAALPVKYLSYGLATLLMALRRPAVRTVVSLGLGVVCVAAVVVVSARAPVWIGAVVVANELLLVLALGLTVLFLRRRRVTIDG